MIGLIPGMLFGQHRLDDFIELAVARSPVLNDYQRQQTIDRIGRQISAAENSGFHLSLSGDYLFAPYFNNHGDYITTSPSPEAVGYDINLFDGGLYSAQVNLERTLFNGRTTGLLDQKLQIDIDRSRYNRALQTHQLKNRVTEQYLQAWQALQMARLSEETADNLSRQLNLTEKLAEKGYAQTQDVLLLKIELKNQTIALCNARQDYRSLLYELYTLCGIGDTTVTEIDSAALTPGAAEPVSGFLQQYTLDSLVTTNRQNLFETKYRPQIGFFFNTGLNAVSLNHWDRKFGLSAGLSLSVPLYDGMQKKLSREQTRVSQKSIRDYRDFSEKQIDLRRIALTSKLRSLKKDIKALKEQADDYRKLLRLSELQLQQGNISMIDHLTLLRNFVEVRKNKIETETNVQLEINRINYWNW